MLVGGAAFAIALPFDQCVVPDGINGPVALFITSDSQPLANNVRDQATDKIIAGPTMAFIDTVPEVLAQFARTGSSSAGTPTVSGSTSTSTETLTPAEASAVLSSAGVPAPTGTAAADNSAPTPAPAPGSSSPAISVVGFSPVPANA